LYAGSALDHEERQKIVEKLHAYTGLPASYIEKANLRISQGEFQLQSNIEYRYYESGHMVYVHEASLRALHDNVASFIERNTSH
jgi:carboxypeptidase C (cathepsin A)